MTAPRLLRVEPRARARPAVLVAVPLAAVAAALLLGAGFLAVTGHAPLEVYARVLRAGFGSKRAITETLVSATPLILTGVAVAVAFRMLVWNIGAEGQLQLGAIAAAGTAIALGPDANGFVAVLVALAAGVAGGAVWAALAAVPRVTLGTNEIITTLMLNFVALHLMNYLIFGSASPWRDPTATNFPQGRPIPEVARLPLLTGRLHVGLLIAVAVAVALWFLVRATRWGFEVRVVGDSPAAARYAGIDVRMKILGVLLLSGALAGLAGAVQVTGTVFALEPRALALGLGFTGIIVAALARLNALMVVPIAVLIGALNNAGSSLQTAGVPVATVFMLQGAILLFAVSGEYLIRHRVRLARPERAAAAVEVGPA